MESMRNPMRFAALLLTSVLALAADKPGYDEVLRAVQGKGAGAGEIIASAMGEENLKKGSAVLTQGGDFLFAVRSTRPVELVVDDGAPVAMTALPGSDLFVYTGEYRTGTSHNFHYMIGEERFGGKTDVPAFGPYSYEKPGVPKGTLSEKMVHTSKIYPGMQNDWWIYVPAGYDASKPAAVMVWQDGQGMVAREGTRAQIVIDNLTHEGKLPVTIHVFIAPGMVGEKRMRAIEYDTVDDTYVRYLLEEMLPQVAAKYKIRTDAYSRAIAGNSSGGICAFNAAWQKPGEFSRVLSRIGSFTSIAWRPGEKDGGNLFPFMIRKLPKRNIRVWLQDGSNDLENTHGSWPLQNLQMANSLKMRGYDFHLSWTNGTHNGAAGNAELPEELLWLWRDYDASKTEQQYAQDPAESTKPEFRVRSLNR
jgi:enterochelin esterase family protein